MKYLSYSILFSAVFLFVQCNGKPERPETVLNETQKTYDGTDLNAAAPVTATPPTAEPAQNADGVWHYICPDGHEGGAGAAAPCPTCSKMMIHNTAYHQGQNAPTTLPGATGAAGGAVQPGSQITFDPSNPGAMNQQISLDPGNSQVVTPQTQAKQEPPQNAAGVWHYTCSNGCAGGAGSATACAGCGSTLVHNSAYHQ